MGKMAKRRSMKRKSMKTMKKRRMSKMRHSKKMIRKSRKMRGGGWLSWLTEKKEEQQPPKYDNITNFSPEYEQQMRENMNKYNLQQQQQQ
jgi:hypothetical protein